MLLTQNALMKRQLAMILKQIPLMKGRRQPEPRPFTLKMDISWLIYGQNTLANLKQVRLDAATWRAQAGGMKTFLGSGIGFSFLLLLSACSPQTNTSSTGGIADTNPPPRLTVELRDGSRVVGDSVAKNFKFQSALLGEIKLNVKDIRSAEGISSNLFKLTTANGDSLTVSFVNSEFAVKTSFGKVDLQVNSVRKFSVAVGGVGGYPPGLVASWPGEGNGLDSIGGNTATLTDITFVEGKVGQAFSFNGVSSSIRIPASSALDVGKGEGFTMTAWVKPTSLNEREQIIEWNNAGPNQTVTWGVHLLMLEPANLNLGAGNLVGNVHGTDGQDHFVTARGGTLAANVFRHIAFSYDKNSGVTRLFCNGTMVAEQNIGQVMPLTAYDLYLGRRPAGNCINSFSGLIDEVQIYNRALSAEEIKSIATE